MTYRLGYKDFFHTFRNQECVVVFATNDPGDWFIAPLNEDGSEGSHIEDMTSEDEEALQALVAQVHWDMSVQDD